MINHSPFLGPHCVQLEHWIECAPFEKKLGIEILSAENGQATLTMPFRAEFANGGNMLHGGALVSLADTAAVMAIKSVLSPESHFGTIDMRAEFLHPVVQGIVTAHSKIKKNEQRLWTSAVTLQDERQRIVMTMHATFKISKRPITPCEPICLLKQ